MKKLIFGYALAFFLSFSTCVVAENEPLNELDSAPVSTGDATLALYQSIKNLDTLSANFEQVITDRDGLEIQQSKGSFSLARPNKIHWQTLPPYEQEIIGDGQTLWVYDADLEQVTQYNDGELLRGPMALFSETLEEIKARFLVSQETLTDATAATQQAEPVSNTGKAKTVQRYTLVPAESDSEEGFSSLVFEFREHELALIEIHDKLRQTTSLSLSEVSRNVDIAAETFSFTPPQGVDVLINE